MVVEQQRPIFLLTVDTEEEWDWHGSFPKEPFSTRNIQCIPEFQNFCEPLGIRPTYFVDHAVAAIEGNRRTLRDFFDQGECDIGAHLHPWCTPPLIEEICDFNSHAINLDTDLFREKMITLTRLLQDSFDSHPTCFRSGRWGLNGRMLQVLIDLGYRVDSSVRPFYKDTAFNYHGAPTRPYLPSTEDLLRHDPHQRSLVEIPASSGFNRSAFEAMDRIHRVLGQAPQNRLRLIGILWRLGILRKITVTPEGNTAEDICACMDQCVKRGDGVINMFFHSSDLLPGNTDYVKDEFDKSVFYATLKECIVHARDVLNARFLTMREAHDHFSRLLAVEKSVCYNHVRSQHE